MIVIRNRCDKDRSELDTYSLYNPAVGRVMEEILQSSFLLLLWCILYDEVQYIKLDYSKEVYATLSFNFGKPNKPKHTTLFFTGIT